MGRMSRVGFIGMRIHTNGRCDAEGSHVTTEDAPMHLWCAMLSKACVQKDHPLSSLHG